MLVVNDFLSCLSDLVKYLLSERIIPQKVTEVINLPTVNYQDIVFWLIILINGYFSYLFYDFHAIDDLPEDHTLSIQMRTGL
jgi:hypothetical protein